MADEVKLGRYKGKEVVGIAIKVTNTGDGLSKAMQVEPVPVNIGERGYVVLEYECVGHDQRPLKDAPSKVMLIQVLKAETATFIDDDVVADAVEKMRIRIEEHVGVQRLDFQPGDGEESETE